MECNTRRREPGSGGHKIISRELAPPLKSATVVSVSFMGTCCLQIQELVGGLDTSTSFAAFDKMEEKVLSLEAEAESTAVLIGSDSLEGKFKELEGGSVNDELAQCAPPKSPMFPSPAQNTCFEALSDAPYIK